MESLIRGADAALLAQTFRAVFAAADLGLDAGLVLARDAGGTAAGRPAQELEEDGLEGQMPHPAME